MNQIDELKKELLDEIAGNRSAWRYTVIPQLCILTLLFVALSAISAFGLYSSVVALREGANVSTLAGAAKIFVGGSSSILGFVLLKVFAKIREVVIEFVAEERQFSSSIGKVRLASNRSTLVGIIDAYGKK